jgi:hypothetical protein
MKPADVVNLAYVLNVIEDPSERSETLRKAYALARPTPLSPYASISRWIKAFLSRTGSLRGGALQTLYTQSEFADELPYFSSSSPALKA